MSRRVQTQREAFSYRYTADGAVEWAERSAATDLVPEEQLPLNLEGDHPLSSINDDGLYHDRYVYDPKLKDKAQNLHNLEDPNLWQRHEQRRDWAIGNGKSHGHGPVIDINGQSDPHMAYPYLYDQDFYDAPKPALFKR
jgi:hypothetical protein